MREALIDGARVVGDAVKRLRAGTPIALDRALPWEDETAYRNVLFQGTNVAVDELRNGADPNGRVVAERFKEVQEALQVFADLWEPMSKPLFRAVLAALDTAAFRVDPWLTGIAERRLQADDRRRRAIPPRRIRLGRRAGAVRRRCPAVRSRPGPPAPDCSTRPRPRRRSPPRCFAMPRSATRAAIDGT